MPAVVIKQLIGGTDGDFSIFSINKGSLAVALREGGFAIPDLHFAMHTEPVPKPSHGPKR